MSEWAEDDNGRTVVEACELESMLAQGEERFQALSEPAAMDERWSDPQDLAELEDLIFQSVNIRQNCAGVYFLIRCGVIVYVGQTSNIHMRLADHIPKKPFDSISFIPIEDETDRILTETLYIDKFNPILNAGPDGKKRGTGKFRFRSPGK